MVPDAYRQRFRSWEKADKQTNVEFARELSKHFNRWCSAVGVITFKDLCDLIVLEQFKDSLPSEVATHIDERGVKTVNEAAILADKYIMARKGKLGRSRIPDVQAKNIGRSAKMSWSESAKPNRISRSGGFDDVCNYCRERGHWKADCTWLKSRFNRGGNTFPKPAALSVPIRNLPVVSDKVLEAVKTGNGNFSGFGAFVSDGFVSVSGGRDKVPVKILRDTGAKDSFILSSVVKFSQDTDTGDCLLVQGMGLETLSVPLHKVSLACGFVTGDVHLGVRPALPLSGVHVVLGNDLAGNHGWVDGAPPDTYTPLMNNPADCKIEFPEVFTACAVTRAMAAKDSEPEDFAVDHEELDCGRDLHVPDSLSISQQELITEQQADASLSELFDQVRPSVEARSAASGYFLQNEVLVRKWVPQGMDGVGDPVYQVVTPTKYRNKVMQCSHDQTGHLGVKKTYCHILRYFFWPRLKRDVAGYIKSCHTCQLTGKPNQTIKPAPLSPIPAVDNPFEHIIIDCVGPLPKSKFGSEYLLTVMCQVTRYPAAYPLRTITAKSVVKALTQFITIFGIPKIIQSDQGSNFSSNLFSKGLKQLNIKHSQASAYHAQSQGALERFHQTLKSLLRAYCTEMQRDWEEGLPWLLLAAREVCEKVLDSVQTIWSFVTEYVVLWQCFEMSGTQRNLRPI